MIKINLKFIALVTIFIVGIIFLVVIIKEKTSPKPLNLILISIDTLRADHMGIYGYSKNTTPNIDKLAKGAFVFTNMRTVVPATFPSFAMLMTGKSIFESKIYNNILSNNRLREEIPKISDKTQTLAQILKLNDFKTAAFVTNPQLKGEITNMNKGFDVYNYHRPVVSDEFERKGYEYFIDSSLKWLDSNQYQKFFLWIHLMDPHVSYVPPANLQCKFDSKYCDVIKEKGVWNLDIERQKVSDCQENIPSKTINLYKTLYDGEVAKSDMLVGLILKKIQDLKLEKNSVIVIYGDHGEGFDHNYYFAHSTVLYDSSIKIPFIIKLPNTTGKKIDTSLDNTQIFDSILSLINIPPSNALNNKSFIADLEDVSGKPDHTNFTYSINNDRSKYSIQNEKLKYIYSIKGYPCTFNNVQDELYDLVKDKDEINNIFDNNSIEAQNLKKKLFNYLKKYDLPKPMTHIQGSKDEIDTIKEKQIFKELKSLGY